MSDDLGAMAVRYTGDLSSLVASVAEAKSSLGGLNTSVSSADEVLSSFSATAESTASTMAMMGQSTVAVDGYLTTLGDRAFTTGVGFDGLSTSVAGVDTSLGSLDASLASVDASAVAADTSIASVGTTAETSSAKLGVLGASAKESSGGLDGLKKAAGALTIVGIVAGVAGIAAIKMAGDFKSGLTSFVTGAGESQKNIGLVRDSILSMAPAVGETTQQLVAGMYMIESGGYHGAAGLNILKDAAEGAKVGNADLGVTADATDTILKNFASTGTTAAQAVNDLIATVSHGKTHMQDLAASLSQILPTAASARIGLSDVSGAMATMTGEGVPASQAATYLRQTIIALEAPGSKAASTLKSIGLTSAEVATEMQKSLPGALEMITDHLKNKFPEGSAAYLEAVKNISGGSRTMQGMLDLTGTHLKTFEGNVLTISDAVKKGGDSIVGWSDVQDTFNQKLDEAEAKAEVLGIELGDKLIPVASEGLDIFGQFASSLSDTSSPVRQLAGDLETFASNVEDTVQKSGVFQSVLQTVHDTLPDVEYAVSNVADALANKLLPPTLDLIKNFSAWVDKSGIVSDALHGLGDGVQTVAGILGPFIQDLSDLFGWLSQNTPAADALKDVVVALGTAFVALKIANTIAGFQQFFAQLDTGAGIVRDLANAFKDKLNSVVSDFIDSNAPNLKGAFSDIGTKAKGAGTDIADIGASAKVSAGEVTAASLTEEGDLATVDASVKGVNTDMIAMGPAAAEGGAAAKLGLAGLVGTLGTIAGYATLLALPFFMVPNGKQSFNPDKQDQYQAPPGFWDFITHLGNSSSQVQDFTQVMVQPTKDSKVFVDNLDKAYQDMQDLYAAAFKRGELLGDLSDPRVMDQADVKVQELKSHLDDLKGPVSIGVITPKVEASRLPVIDLKSHVDDLRGPVSIGVLTPQVIAARLPVIDLKSHVDDLKNPRALSIGTRSVDAAQLKVIDLKSHADDLTKTEPLSIGTRSVDDAILKVMELKNQIDDLPPVQIPGGYGFHGHASGILNNPVGHVGLVGEKGAELMYIPQGASIFPHDETMGMLSGGNDYSMAGGWGGGENMVVEIHSYHYWDGADVTNRVMTKATSTVRRRGRNRR